MVPAAFEEVTCTHGWSLSGHASGQKLLTITQVCQDDSCVTLTCQAQPSKQALELLQLYSINLLHACPLCCCVELVASTLVHANALCSAGCSWTPGNAVTWLLHKDYCAPMPVAP